MYETRQHKEKVSRQIEAGGGARNQMKIADRRESNYAIQLRASIIQQPQTPSASRTISLDSWDRVNRLVYFKAVPGFGQNYGTLGSRTYTSYGSGHTEPNLISMEYTQNHTVGDWDVANAAVRSTNRRHSFTLYTERAPCDICSGNLALDIYTPNDRVLWSIPNRNRVAMVLQPQYINDANRYLQTHYPHMNPNRTWFVNKFGTPKLICHY